MRFLVLIIAVVVVVFAAGMFLNSRGADVSLPSVPDMPFQDDGVTRTDNRPEGQAPDNSAYEQETQRLQQTQDMMKERQELTEQQQLAPLEAEKARLDAELEIMKKREEIKQMQRDAVPSVLPEHTITPAKLGNY